MWDCPRPRRWPRERVESESRSTCVVRVPSEIKFSKEIPARHHPTTRRRSYDRSLTTEYLLSRRGAPLLIIVEPRLEGVLGLDRLALAILPRLLPSRRRRRQGLAIKQCLHIRLYESDRVAPWVASQRAATLVEKELLVVEDDARDAPWVGARLGQPRVERQSVRAEQVRLCV